MTDQRTETETYWRTNEVEGDDGQLAAVTLVRTETVYPMTKVGRRQWKQGKEQVTAFGPIPVAEIPRIMEKLADVLTYYASGNRASERALERALEEEMIHG